MICRVCDRRWTRSRKRDGVIVYGSVGAAVIAAGALTAWLIARARAPRRIASPEEAADAADTLPGFTTAGAVVGSDGLGALAVDGAGRVAVVVRRGAKVAAHEIDWTAVTSVPGGMAVDAGAVGRVTVAGIDHLDVRRLAPVLARR